MTVEKWFQNAVSVDRLTGTSWAELTVGELLASIASPLPAPGGGSVSALLGAMGAGLVSMTASLAAAKGGQMAARLEELAAHGRALADTFTELARRDTAAFLEVAGAYRLPRATPDEKEARRAAVAEATRLAALVPSETGERALELAELVADVASFSLPATTSDLGVALECARAAIEGAVLNVEANLSGLGAAGAAFTEEYGRRVHSLRQRGKDAYAAARKNVGLAASNPTVG